MFEVRVVTPVVTNDEGWRHAAAKLQLGEVRLCFLIDLTHWSVRDYEQQWRDGCARLVAGAPSSALMTAYRGPGDEPHTMWALWRDDEHIYIQEQTVLPSEVDVPWDPRAPYVHVGVRVPASDQALPISEWRTEIVQLYAAALGIRWPFYPL